jgi:predicted RNA-binding Zn-ribbon protein involved in translation (DUF1610 family)
MMFPGMRDSDKGKISESEKSGKVCPECGASTQKQLGTVTAKGNSKTVTSYSTCSTCGKIIETISHFTNRTGSDFAPEWVPSNNNDPLSILTRGK